LKEEIFLCFMVSKGFLLCLLAQHPEVQERARNEAKEVFGTGASIGSETLGQLPYISACFHEALRLFPPALTNAIEAMEDCTLEGFGPVCKGDLIGIDYYAMNHHPTVFETPGLFLPERYLVKTEEMREREDASTHTPVFSFSQGPHVCLGKFLALLEGRIFTAMLLTHFRLRLPGGYKVEYADENEIVGRCVQGGQVIFEAL
jgi:cytochrome P450